MVIQIRCAWCGDVLGIKEGELAAGLTTGPTVCPNCEARVGGVASTWDGVERRASADRRKGERRISMRSSVHTLIVIDGITWIDNRGSDRRHFLRRLSDRERLASRIISGRFN